MIVGFGSAHIDILATVTGDPKTKDRIGKVAMDIGGTGGNVAINCAALNVPTRFVTALNGSAHSRIIVEHLEKGGVELLVLEDRSLPMAAFVAQINPAGDMDSAISCMPVESVNFDDSFVAQALEDATLAFADCNLSVASLEQLSSLCHAQGVPFFMAAVSEEKAMRAVGILRRGFTAQAVFLNRREVEYVKARIAIEPLPRSVRSKVIEDRALAEMLRCRLVITEGADGAMLVEGNQVHRILAPKINEVRSLLGAGDAFMAGALAFFEAEGGILHKALARAAVTAADVVLRDNCSLAEPRAIDRAIDFFHDEARKDGLTQIFNRASTMHFGEKILSKTTKQHKPFSTIILDIDHFKSINDTWGHPEGDKVIKLVARIVQQAMRESDICGRWGGEEFVCLLPGATEEVALKVAERIRSTIEENVREPKVVTVSLGVALSRPGVGLAAIISEADKALYISKNSGRNRVTLFAPP